MQEGEHGREVAVIFHCVKLHYRQNGKLQGEMKTMQRVRSVLKFIVLAVIAVSVFPAVTFAQHYTQTDLVSDIAGLAKNRDANLVNPWGLARSRA